MAYGQVAFDAGIARAREAATRALAIDPDLAEAHLALGYLQFTMDWDWAAADQSFQKALALDPGNAVALRHAGNLASTLGRWDESIRLLRQSLERDPLRSATYNGLANTLVMAERYSEAMAMFRKILELQPDFVQKKKAGPTTGTGLTSYGSGGVICAVPALPQRVLLKKRPGSA